MTLVLPGFSVIIPTYNRAAVVVQTVRCLLAQDYPADLLEVILVDNSTDGTPEAVRAAAAGSAVPVHVIESPERFPATKRNIGLRLARHDLALFMNDDVWVTTGFLRAHAQAHQAHQRPVAVLGHVEQSPKMPWTPFIEAYLPFAYWEIEDRAGEPLPYRYFWSMNLSVPRREMLDRNLVFHEDWAEIGHEDVELGWRWTAAGNLLVYAPDAWGEHFHPHDLDSACRLQRTIGRGLRDLEALIPDPGLLERYGVLSRRNRPRSRARGLAREALFNPLTVPVAKRWLETRRRNTTLTRWMYWKVLLRYTNRGYREAARRSPRPIPTLEAVP
jgi:glycosyltransferase involved in cell wall biosynthesis